MAIYRDSSIPFVSGVVRGKYNKILDFLPYILSKIDKDQVGTGCWFYNGSHSKGYATSATEGGARRVYAYLYQRLIGPVPDGLVLDHLCRCRGCVNPHHLEPITSSENVKRGWRDRRC